MFLLYLKSFDTVPFPLNFSPPQSAISYVHTVSSYTYILIFNKYVLNYYLVPGIPPPGNVGKFGAGLCSGNCRYIL